MIRGNRSRGQRNHLSSISTARVCVIVVGQTHTHEEVIRVWHIAADTEQFHKIMELTVDVTANLQPSPVSKVLLLARDKQAYRHRRIHAHHIALLNEQLPRLVADFPHLRFGYRATCSKLFYVPAACQELAHRPLIARAYLSRSLILAAAPCGATVVFSDFYSGAVLRSRALTPRVSNELGCPFRCGEA